MTETYTYDAFGTLTYIQSLNEEGVLAQTDTALSRFLYAGEQYDEVSGLYYLRARRYDTMVGRFTQEDTYLGDGRNLYVYVQNNPLKYVDPSGHSTKNLGYTESTDYLGYYSMYDPSNPVKVNEPGWFSHGDLDSAYIEHLKNSYAGKVWDALYDDTARAVYDMTSGYFYQFPYRFSSGRYHDPIADDVYYEAMFQLGRDIADIQMILPYLGSMLSSVSGGGSRHQAKSSGNELATTSQNTSLLVIDQGLNTIDVQIFVPAISVTGTYEAPPGGGGISATIKIGDQTVNFGHGGRHLEGTGLNVNSVNRALAEEVIKLNLKTGQFYKGQIVIEGVTIEYTSFGVSDGIINIGTYYLIQ